MWTSAGFVLLFPSHDESVQILSSNQFYLGMPRVMFGAGFFYTGPDPLIRPGPFTKRSFFFVKGLGLIRGPKKKK